MQCYLRTLNVVGRDSRATELMRNIEFFWTRIIKVHGIKPTMNRSCVWEPTTLSGEGGRNPARLRKELRTNEKTFAKRCDKKLNSMHSSHARFYSAQYMVDIVKKCQKSYKSMRTQFRKSKELKNQVPIQMA